MSLKQRDYDFGRESNYAFAREITCSSDEARRLWARGYCFLLNYNHEEAAACFQQVTNEDPDCAMAYWGIAYALSPSYNWPPGLGSGYDPIQQALSLLDDKKEIEKDLIRALVKRHSAEARDSADPAALKMGNDPALGPAYCEAMAAVYEKYKESPDVAALYAEALMNLKPWTLWNKNTETGEITPADDNTLKILKVLEAQFEQNGFVHPGLCHCYIHTCELSPFPERALPAADALRTLMPDAGHLVHMASHIDAWVGQWKESIACNSAGVVADDKYVKQSGKNSMFYKFYRMHNDHFVVWSAMFDGQFSTALKFARKMESELPSGVEGVEYFIAEVIPMGAVFLEAFLTVKWHVLVRFGRWGDILSEPTYSDKNIYAGSIAAQHYARGVAYAAKGMVEEAEEEQELFLTALENPALAGRVLHNNKMYQDPSDGPSIFAVSKCVLAGEIEYRRQFLRKQNGLPADFTVTYDHLRKGVKLDINLAYDEPWGQMQPVRHILGALLFEQGNVEEAEDVYRKDLALWKDNMWGLLGLKLCLESRLAASPGEDHVKKELSKISALHAERSKRADIVPTKTCFCAQDSIKRRADEQAPPKTFGGICCSSKVTTAAVAQQAVEPAEKVSFIAHAG